MSGKASSNHAASMKSGMERAESWAMKLDRLKKAHKIADAELNAEAIQHAKENPDLSEKLMSYQAECEFLDKVINMLKEQEVIHDVDFSNEKQRSARDKETWKKWLAEEKERHKRIRQDYKDLGKKAPKIDTTHAMAAQEAQPRKKRVRFVLPGEPGDPWKQEVPKGAARLTKLREEAQRNPEHA